MNAGLLNNIKNIQYITKTTYSCFRLTLLNRASSPS